MMKYEKAVKKLIVIGAVNECVPVAGQFISSYFLVPKSDNKFRFILNLKRLNTFLLPVHFKMDDYRTVKNIITKSAYMATLDLKDAYFLIPVFKPHRKYLRFVFQGKLFEFSCLPFGLCTAPFVFTKILKPVTQYLRSGGNISVNYLDDFFLLGGSHSECLQNMHDSISLLEALGFLINYPKSCLIPSRECKYLGFLFNSSKLTISLPRDKIKRNSKLIRSFLEVEKCKIRSFAKLIGSLISVCPAIRYGWLYTKILEREKFLALKYNNGNYNSKMFISQEAKSDLLWWLKVLPNSQESLLPKKYELEIYTDASKYAWGAVCKGEACHGFLG